MANKIPNITTSSNNIIKHKPLKDLKSHDTRGFTKMKKHANIILEHSLVFNGKLTENRIYQTNTITKPNHMHHKMF